MNNDLISRSELKEKLQARYDNGEEDFDKGYNIGIETALDLIDNAPTVEAEIKEVPIAKITFDETKLKELVDDLVEKIKSGEIVVYDAVQDEQRPAGQWLFHRCSNCGSGFDLNINLDRYNYCPVCGTQMRGAEND